MIKNKYVVLTILITIIICFFITINFSWKGDNGKGYTHVIDSDGKGYYMYLPAIFIKKNISNQEPDQRFIFKTEKGAINKYYVGTAVCMLPFYVVGYITAYLTDAPLDGYSSPFQKAISYAGLFYLLMGLFFTGALLILYDVKPLVVSITIVLIVFGTNLLMYSVYHPSLSHVYSFCFVSMFLYHVKKFIQTKKTKSAIIFTFAFAMIFIIRPVNGIIIFMIPFLAGSIYTFKVAIIDFIKPNRILILITVFLMVISIQLYVGYLQTGEFFVWSYQNEGFYFANPQLWNVLFSFRKGFFIYTPLALLSLFGLVILFKNNRFQFYTVLLFLFLLVYITASWWCWYYGPSFGQRSFVEFYPIIALLLASLHASIKKVKHQLVFYSLAFCFTIFNLLQSYQYSKYIISSWDMNFEKYEYVFLKTSDKYIACLGGCKDIKPYCKKEKVLFDLKNNFETKEKYWSESVVKIIKDEHKTVCDYSGREFNCSLTIEADSNLLQHRLIYAEICLDKMETKNAAMLSPLVVVAIADTLNVNYHYYIFSVNEIPCSATNTWQKITYTVEITKLKEIGDRLQIYIWNKNLQDFYIDNFNVKLIGID